MALVLVPGLAVAGQTLSGRFQAEHYGVLELKTEGEHVTGVLVGENACDFEAGRQVLEGDFQGSVLVARLTLCQVGDTCPPEQTYAVLGFYTEEKNMMVAHVRLSEGCQSQALPRSGRFRLEPVAQQIPSETPTSGTGNSAVELASRRGVRSLEAAKQALALGSRLYMGRDYKEAVRQFEISLSHDPGDGNWPAYLGRGSSRLKLAQVDAAIKDLERSRIGNGSKDPHIFYMLGCAYGQKGQKDKALSYLGRAVKAGYRLHEAVGGDPDLMRSLGNEPQFQELLRRSREKNSQFRGTAGPGSQSP